VILLFAPAAAAEHLAQVEYYESKQPGLGARYLAEVVAALDYIIASPRSFPIVRPPSLRRLVMRRFPFSVIFAESAESIRVLAIAPHRRAPGYWSSRALFE
jgi:toxin ParE1/3/4